MLTIYKFEADFDRGRTIESTFAAEPADLAKAYGRRVEFYEPWGKHSEAWADLEAGHFTVISDNPVDVEVFVRLKLHEGPDLLGWLDDNVPGWRGEVTP